MRRWWPGFVLFYITLCTSALGQSARLLLSSESDGDARTLILKLWLDAPSVSPAGLQWTFVYLPEQVWDIAVSGGPAVQEAHKSLSCAHRPGALNCISVGPNAIATEPGLIALVRVTLAPAVIDALIPVYDAVGVSPTGRELEVDSNVGFIHRDLTK